jgi:8-oxo-dGTP pyrophosphatase MutT (NUDIX family)
MFLSHGLRRRLKERVRLLFGGLPSRTQVAALPWRRTSDGHFEVMMVTSRGTGRWVLPKGWPEGQEHPYEAAEREAAEEAGVSGSIAHQQIGEYLYHKKLNTGLERRCQVLVFSMEVDQVADKWPERKKRQRRWFRPQDAARLVEEPELGELISSFGINPRKTAA